MMTYVLLRLVIPLHPLVIIATPSIYSNPEPPPTCHWLSIPDPSGPIPHPCGGSLFILHCTTPEEWITNQLLCILSSRSQQQSRPPQHQLSPIKISWLCIHANIHVHATNTSLHSWSNDLVIISE